MILTILPDILPIKRQDLLSFSCSSGAFLRGKHCISVGYYLLPLPCRLHFAFDARAGCPRCGQQSVAHTHRAVACFGGIVLPRAVYPLLTSTARRLAACASSMTFSDAFRCARPSLLQLFTTHPPSTLRCLLTSSGGKPQWCALSATPCACSVNCHARQQRDITEEKEAPTARGQKNREWPVSRRNIPSQNLYRDEKTISNLDGELSFPIVLLCLIDIAKLRTSLETTKCIPHFFMHKGRFFA